MQLISEPDSAGAWKAPETSSTQPRCWLPMKSISPEDRCTCLGDHTFPAPKNEFSKIDFWCQLEWGINSFVEFLQAFFCKAFLCSIFCSFSIAKLQGTIAVIYNLLSHNLGGGSPELTWALSSPGQCGREGIKPSWTRKREIAWLQD